MHETQSNTASEKHDVTKLDCSQCNQHQQSTSTTELEVVAILYHNGKNIVLLQCTACLQHMHGTKKKDLLSFKATQHQTN